MSTFFSLSVKGRPVADFWSLIGASFGVSATGITAGLNKWPGIFFVDAALGLIGIEVVSMSSSGGLYDLPLLIFFGLGFMQAYSLCENLGIFLYPSK
jgi:hypothetical protein